MEIDVARLMVSSGIVPESEIRKALEVQTKRGGSLPRICHSLGILDENRWARVLAKALKLPTVDVSQLDVEPVARSKVGEPLLRELAAFPFQLRDMGRTLVLAMAEPQDDVARAQLKAASNCELKIAVAGYGQIEQALDKHPPMTSPSGVSNFLAQGREGELDFEPGDFGGEDMELETLAEVAAAAATLPPPARAPSSAALPYDRPPSSASVPQVRPPSSPGRFSSGMFPVVEAVALTAEQAAKLQALEQEMYQARKALYAALDLCFERGVFTPQELDARKPQ